jgi:hypothetical protein
MFREFWWRFWRIAVARQDGRKREVQLLWSDGCQPETFTIFLRLWACRHTRTLTVHRADGTCGEQCLDCPDLLNYRLNKEQAWLAKRYWEAHR